MDLRFTKAEQAFRAAARAWLAEHVPREALPSGDTREGFTRCLQWERELFEGGWAVVSWPKEYGGRGASLIEWLIFEEEYYLSGAPSRVTQNGIFLLAPTLFEFGTEEQKARILRPMAAAEVTWAQAWSEPNAGSDLASLKSKAVRVDGGWRLSGQKTWCTRGAFSDWIYGLFRTDPEARRHRGLTYFMVPLDAEGVAVRGVERLDGDEGFAEVFLEDVFVPDADVIGEVDRGWYVAMATTSSERGLSLRSPGRFVATAERLIELYRRVGDRARPELRDRVVRAWMDAQAYRLYTFQTVAKLMAGGSIGAESSINKIFWSDMDVRTHETALELIGELAELDEGAPDAVEGGAWLRGFQFSLAGPIYAGTNEIQRNVVAQRVLGLPEVAMRFAFTEEQLLFRDAARELLSRECTPAVVRRAWGAESGAAGVWGKLAEMGVLGMVVPEAAGGLGLGMSELVLILEESGRAALPEPLTETAAAAAWLIGEVGSAELRKRWLPRIVAGDVRVALGLGGEQVISGAAEADLLLLARDGELHGVKPERCAMTAQQSVDRSRRLQTVVWEPAAETLIAADAGREIEWAWDLAALGTAAELLGLAGTLLEMTVEYAQVREQFGKPIGTFQAVKHKLADVCVALEFAKPAVYRAAWSVDQGEAEAGTHISMAKAYASDAAELASRHALQCHGAIGYTTEYDLHLWMKRVWALSRASGDAAWHRKRIAERILGES